MRNVTPKMVAVVAFVAMVALAAPARAQYVIGTRDSLTARVDSIFSAYDRTNAPGCAVGVYCDGKIVYASGYGMASLKFGAPITPRTVFNLASNTKPFTATAVLLLAHLTRHIDISGHQSRGSIAHHLPQRKIPRHDTENGAKRSEGDVALGGVCGHCLGGQETLGFGCIVLANPDAFPHLRPPFTKRLAHFGSH